MMTKLKEAVQVVRQKVTEVLPMSFEDALEVYLTCLRGGEPELRTLCRAIQALLRDVGVCDETVFLSSRLHKASAEEFIRDHVRKMREQDPQSAVAQAFETVIRGGHR